MTVVNKVHVVGISDDGLQGLSSLARERLAVADLVIGDTQLLDLVEDVLVLKIHEQGGHLLL